MIKTTSTPLIVGDRAPAITQALIHWFRQSARDLPWRQTTEPYAIWIAEIMLQQTQVATVIPYWDRWMRQLPAIAHVASASEQTLLKLWEGLGYYSRVRNIQKAARQVLDRHGGIFPTSYEEILALPGIGRYTAGAISSIAFDQPKPLLDGNVIRVLARLFGIQENPKAKIGSERFWAVSAELVEAAHALQPRPSSTRPCADFNQSLMELGALVCLPRAPVCGACPVSRHCFALREGQIEILPNLPSRPALTHRRFIAFVFSHEECFLVRQRPPGQVNAGFWEFPNEELEGSSRGERKIARQLRIEIPPSFLSFTHSITRYRIALRAFAAVLDLTRAGLAVDFFGGSWVPASALSDLPFTSAHRKIANAVLGSKKQSGGLIPNI